MTMIPVRPIDCVRQQERSFTSGEYVGTIIGGKVLRLWLEQSFPLAPRVTLEQTEPDHHVQSFHFRVFSNTNPQRMCKKEKEETNDERRRKDPKEKNLFEILTGWASYLCAS